MHFPPPVFTKKYQHTDRFMTQRQNSPFRRLNLQIRHPLFANSDLFPIFVTVNIDVYSVSICLSFSLKCHGSTNEEFVHWAAAIRESGSFFCSGKSFASDAEGNRRRAVAEANSWSVCKSNNTNANTLQIIYTTALRR